MKFLLTGFAPFGGHDTNPSWDCLQSLPPISGAEILLERLPVSFAQAPVALRAALERHKPHAVICFGVAVGRTKITPEKIAINLAHGRIADNDGAQPVDEPLIPGAPDGRFSTLPVFKLAELLEAAGIPTQVSYTAGAYVCNCVMYHLLDWAVPKGIPAGFVHVPGEMDMPVERCTEAVAKMVAYLAETLPISCN